MFNPHVSAFDNIQNTSMKGGDSANDAKETSEEDNYMELYVQKELNEQIDPIKEK